MTRLRATSLLLTVALAGCGDVEDDLDTAIEQEHGGLTMDDEAPMFGDELAFEEAGEADIDAEFVDPMESDAELITMMEAPDAAIARVRIVWGMIPARPDVEAPRNWTGTIAVNRGALLVRSTIAFEPATDRVLARDSRTTVRFTSVTRPHRDGLVLTVIDPTPLADEPLTLTYTTVEGDTYEATIADLVAGPVEGGADDLGNRIVAVALRRPVDVCEHGFLGGKWHQVRPGRGVLIGRVVSAEGAPMGHMRGLYGERASGERVFFGKYINTEGEFRGIFAGTYREGHFAGRWLTRAEERGVLAGHYREDAPGDRVGGHFLGRWAEKTCAVDLPDAGE